MRAASVFSLLPLLPLVAGLGQPLGDAPECTAIQTVTETVPQWISITTIIKTKKPCRKPRQTITVTAPGTTVTEPGSTVTLPVPEESCHASTAMPGEPITHTITIPGEEQTHTITVPGEEQTQTITIPGEEQVVTITIPGEEQVVTQTITLPGEEQVVTQTITLPGQEQVVTETITLPGEEQVVTQTITLPGQEEVITVTEPTTITLPGEEQVITVTEPTTITLPGEEQVITVTEPTTILETQVTTQIELERTTITEISTSTSTTTETSTFTTLISCPSGNPVVNGDFQSPIGGPGNWIAFPSSNDVTIERVAFDSPEAMALRFYFAPTAPNLSQRVTQALHLCPGATYKVSWKGRALTSTNIRYKLSIDGTVMTSLGVIGGPTNWINLATYSNGLFTASSNTATLSAEVLPMNGEGTVREALLDDIVLTRVS